MVTLVDKYGMLYEHWRGLVGSLRHSPKGSVLEKPTGDDGTKITYTICGVEIVCSFEFLVDLGVVSYGYRRTTVSGRVVLEEVCAVYFDVNNHAGDSPQQRDRLFHDPEDGLHIAAINKTLMVALQGIQKRHGYVPSAESVIDAATDDGPPASPVA